MKEVTKTFLSGKLSATLIIPIEMARRHGLDEPSHVVVEERGDGILIRRLEIRKDEKGSVILFLLSRENKSLRLVSLWIGRPVCKDSQLQGSRLQWIVMC